MLYFHPFPWFVPRAYQTASKIFKNVMLLSTGIVEKKNLVLAIGETYDEDEEEVGGGEEGEEEKRRICFSERTSYMQPYLSNGPVITETHEPWCWHQIFISCKSPFNCTFTYTKTPSGLHMPCRWFSATFLCPPTLAWSWVKCRRGAENWCVWQPLLAGGVLVGFHKCT